MVKIYGSSDDLVCLDNSNYAEDEIYARRTRQTTMQQALSEEHDILMRAALRNAKQYADAEAATKDFVLG